MVEEGFYYSTGVLRTTPVKIGGTSWTTDLPIESVIKEELKTIIDQKKTGEFKLTYADQDELYIVVGYGKQLTGGYSIQFPDVYLTKENIVVTSVLLGPEGEEPANISYPYAVIKIEYRPEPVLFQ